jgi:hypothetical protein
LFSTSLDEEGIESLVASAPKQKEYQNMRRMRSKECERQENRIWEMKREEQVLGKNRGKILEGKRKRLS